MATPLGSSAFDLFEQCVDLVDDLRGVRTGGLEDHRADARMAVGVALVGIGFAAQLDVGDVFQAQDRTVGLCESSTISPNSSGVIVTSAVLHRVLERVLRVFTQRTGCRLDVLLGEGRRYVRRDELVLGHHVGLEPDTHRVVGSQREGFADARGYGERAARC